MRRRDFGAGGKANRARHSATPHRSRVSIWPSREAWRSASGRRRCSWRYPARASF